MLADGEGVVLGRWGGTRRGMCFVSVSRIYIGGSARTRTRVAGPRFNRRVGYHITLARSDNQGPRTALPAAAAAAADADGHLDAIVRTRSRTSFAPPPLFTRRQSSFCVRPVQLCPQRLLYVFHCLRHRSEDSRRHDPLGPLVQLPEVEALEEEEGHYFRARPPVAAARALPALPTVHRAPRNQRR